MIDSPLSKPDFITIREAYEHVRKDAWFIITEQQVLKLLAGVAPAHQERAKQFLFCVLHWLDPSQIFIIETGGLKCYLISYANKVIQLLRLDVPIYRT